MRWPRCSLFLTGLTAGDRPAGKRDPAEATGPGTTTFAAGEGCLHRGAAPLPRLPEKRGRPSRMTQPAYDCSTTSDTKSCPCAPSDFKAQQESNQFSGTSMEEDQVVEQQDDLDRMLAQMMAEALKRGKNWLCAKMEEKSEERQIQDLSAPGCLTLADETNAAGGITPRPQKSSKRQRTEGKPAKKTAKKPTGTEKTTGETPTRAPPESSISCIPAEGEHISAIIKECFKSFAPLLLRVSGAGPSIEGAGKGELQGHASIGKQPGTHAVSKERLTPGDPLTAWGAAGKVIDPPMAAGNPPESYARPSLGPPTMTTRAAGLATAILLAVKERI
ncbi:hypothetical protein NDU88_005911 [Pleurodeles waltl]|uniref:Uncharacterized protein n=1 Tax=Pleurodeles waltl TaxID=8319 RepID=A0AAV7UJH9_PLEWA|nr:hypothetical protein NDU88_005911 [Pleurodeles waltl]